MPDCRICGASCSHSELTASGCVNCKGAPDCGRCGHPRRKHRGTFGGGQSECTTSVAADDRTLAIGRCACPGYSSEPGDDDVGVKDVRVPRLRPPGA
jgi:hypothetical protein